jgi:hypothetical protein
MKKLRASVPQWFKSFSLRFQLFYSSYSAHLKPESEASHDLPYISMNPAPAPMTPVMGLLGER